MTSIIPNEKFFLDFAEFLKEYNVVGLGIGTVVAQSTLDMGKSFTDTILLPLVNGILSRTVPIISYKGLLSSLVAFLVTMFVIYVAIKLFKIELTKPVSYVKIVQEGYYDDATGEMTTVPVMVANADAPAMSNMPNMMMNNTAMSNMPSNMENNSESIEGFRMKKMY